MGLRLISLNAWGGRLHEPLIRFIADTAPHILCLQEVTRSLGTDEAWLTYRDGGFALPQRANLYDDVKAILSGHEAIYAPVARGTLFQGKRPVLSEFGLATFIEPSLPVIGQRLDFVHGTFSDNGWGDHPRPRNAHAIRLFRYDVGKAITIVQLHGLRDPEGKEDTAERLAQAYALVKLIETVRQPDDDLVVCGDLNLLPGSETFRILAEIGLRDLVTSRGFVDTRTSWYSKQERFADYLLVTPQVKVGAFNVVASPEVSDHRALLLDIA